MKNEFSQALEAAVGALVSEYNFACEKLTKEQLASAIQQALQAGDFVRHISMLNQQQVVYHPFRQVETLREENEALRTRVQELEKIVEAVGVASGYAERLRRAEEAADRFASEAAGHREYYHRDYYN